MDGAGKPWTLSSLALMKKVLLSSPDSCFACWKKQEDEDEDEGDDHDEAIDTQTLEIMCKPLVLHQRGGRRPSARNSGIIA